MKECEILAVLSADSTALEQCLAHPRAAQFYAKILLKYMAQFTRSSFALQASSAEMEHASKSEKIEVVCDTDFGSSTFHLDSLAASVVATSDGLGNRAESTTLPDGAVAASDLSGSGNDELLESDAASDLTGSGFDEFSESDELCDRAESPTGLDLSDTESDDITEPEKRPPPVSVCLISCPFDAY